MGLGEDTKKLIEDILGSYDLRVKEIRKLEKDTKSMLNEFQGKQKDMAAELKKTFKQAEADRLKAEADRLKAFGSMKNEIQAEQKDRNKEVADLLKEHKTEREKMSASWQALNAAMAKRRSGKPTVEAEVKVSSVKEAIEEETKERKVSPGIGLEEKEAIEEETKERKVSPGIGLEEKVLGFIKRHPEGVKVGDMEEPLETLRMRLGVVAKGLLAKGKVRKEKNMYFPIL